MRQNKNPKNCNSINEIRDEIDEIDKELIMLFAKRNEYIKEIVSYKKDEEGVVALERKESVINERGRLAKKHGLNPNIYKKIFILLIEHNINKELEIFRLKKQKNKVKS